MLFVPVVLVALGHWSQQVASGGLEMNISIFPYGYNIIHLLGCIGHGAG